MSFISNMNSHWAQHLDLFRDKRVLVVGDSMLDHYLYGYVERISPEAPVPILVQQSQDLTLGGAANVARNVLLLGGSCDLYTVVGSDKSGRDLLDLLINSSINFIGVKGKTTEVKCRMIASGQQLFRVDTEGSKEPLKPLDRLPYDVIIISDYDKGVFNSELAKWAVSTGIPCVVDSKPRRIPEFFGATLFTPNKREAAETLGWDYRSCSDLDLARAFQESLGGSVVVTCGPNGMCLAGDSYIKIPPFHVESRDPTGAGDVVTACMGLTLASGLDLVTGATIANRAAALSVSKTGTYAVGMQELRESLLCVPPPISFES